MQDAHNFCRVNTSTVFDLVVHCAAREPHRAAIDAVNANFSYNVALDAAIFSWAMYTHQRRLLYVSSSAIYPVALQTDEFIDTRLHEVDAYVDLADALDDSPVRVPDRTYGWTKYVGELQAVIAQRNGLPVHIVRPFSGYGEDQSENFPFRAFVERARRREDPFTIWGRADQTRDFIHVSDLVNGALAVVDADECRPVNLCTGVGTSLLDLALLVQREVDYAPVTLVDPDQPLGVTHRVGDPTIMNELHTAKISIEKGVRRALAW
jgi:nucleoside-diphosphate-sugar epimerase